MYSRILKYIQDEKLFVHSDKLLLGVSGGIDSVVLTNLIEHLGNNYALAHCNFNLRGQDSDDDEKFVLNLANKLGVKCFLSSFTTREFAHSKNISIEMAARELRYNWFEKTRIENDFDWILVAHHLDDVLETVLLNLSRGTGIRGLSGIKAKAGKVVRPLLFASRNEIEDYANQHQLNFRHDASNDDTLIKRNKVRHQILPLFEELSPAFRKNLQRTISYLNGTEEVFLNKIEEVRKILINEENNWVKITIDKLNKLKPLSVYLYELLRTYHFNSDVVEQISTSLSKPESTGLQFYSFSHRLVIDRDELIITPIDTHTDQIYYIDKNVEFVHQPLHLKITVERYHPDYIIPRVQNVAVFDYDKLRFPLMLRHWQQGEYFKPLGMNGLKKLSNFFIDEKYSIPEKENAWILASENKVVWVVGKRIDDRFKITSDTTLLFRIEIITSDNA